MKHGAMAATPRSLAGAAAGPSSGFDASACVALTWGALGLPARHGAAYHPYLLQREGFLQT